MKTRVVNVNRSSGAANGKPTFTVTRLVYQQATSPGEKDGPRSTEVVYTGGSFSLAETAYKNARKAMYT